MGDRDTVRTRPKHEKWIMIAGLVNNDFRVLKKITMHLLLDGMDPTD